MIILGIETSCDETAAAIVEGDKKGIKVLSNVVSSQIEIHKKYGGVVPEVAAREHVFNVLPVVNEALEKAHFTPPARHASRAKAGGQPPLLNRRGGAKGRGIDAIAVTVGPGLITSLIVGVETAKVLSYTWGIPLLAINHIEGHIYANFIGVNSKFKTSNSKHLPAGRQECQNSKPQIPNIEFPALILTVSGGHTMLVLMAEHGRYKVIGDTRDDAAGEAFDKAAKLLGIGYPGGPAIAAEAAKFSIFSPKADQPLAGNFQFSIKSEIENLKSKISLPRPMINSGDYDFSFSGLKTSLLYKLKKDKNWEKKVPEYCSEFQQAVIDVLIAKTVKAARDFKVKTVMLAGGVAANQELRRQIKEKIEIQVPDLKYTTDNAAMVATAGYFRALKKDFIPWEKIKVDPNLELSARGLSPRLRAKGRQASQPEADQPLAGATGFGGK